MDQATVLPSHGAGSASQCSTVHVPAADTRTEAPIDTPTGTPSPSATRRSESPVTFTESDVAVGMSISRVPQHRVMSDSAGDGRELFRWPWNGRLSVIFSLLSTLRGGQKVTETVTYTRYLASGTCLTLCTHRQYTCGGGGDRKPRTKSF